MTDDEIVEAMADAIRALPEPSSYSVAARAAFAIAKPLIASKLREDILRANPDWIVGSRGYATILGLSQPTRGAA